MSIVSIDMPDETRLQFEIKDIKIVEEIIKILKESGVKKKNEKDNEIIGIWKDRFENTVSSEMIQKEYREKTWVRF